MLIKSMDDDKEATLNAENLHIIRRIIDDFETTQLKRCVKKPKNNRFRKISRSDSIINRSRISPVQVVHRGYDRAASLQDVIKSEDSLYLNICETNASVENADANSAKIFDGTTTRRATKAYIGNSVKGVSKALDEAAAAAQKKHQEMVMKGVQEVGTWRVEFFFVVLGANGHAILMMVINYVARRKVVLFLAKNKLRHFGGLRQSNRVSIAE